MCLLVAVSRLDPDAPLLVGAAHISLRDKDATIVAASDRARHGAALNMI